MRLAIAVFGWNELWPKPYMALGNLIGEFERLGYCQKRASLTAGRASVSSVCRSDHLGHLQRIYPPVAKLTFKIVANSLIRPHVEKDFVQRIIFGSLSGDSPSLDRTKIIPETIHLCVIHCGVDPWAGL